MTRLWAVMVVAAFGRLVAIAGAALSAGAIIAALSRPDEVVDLVYEQDHVAVVVGEIISSIATIPCRVAGKEIT